MANNIGGLVAELKRKEAIINEARLCELLDDTEIVYTEDEPIGPHNAEDLGFPMALNFEDGRRF